MTGRDDEGCGFTKTDRDNEVMDGSGAIICRVMMSDDGVDIVMGSGSGCDEYVWGLIGGTGEVME